MKVLCYCFVLLSLLIFLDGRRFRCDYRYFQKLDGYLKYHEMPSNWHEAQLRCHMEGAVLASPLTAALKEAMLVLVPNNTGVPVIYTGIHSKFSRGDFFSVEGTPLSRIAHTWADGEPNNANDEEGCLVMVATGDFADVDCKKAIPYICYKKAEPGMTINACGTNDNDYQLDSRTGSCYKFHRYPRYWSRAFMTCAAEGGYLAIINSETEAQVIRDLYAKYPDLGGVGDYHVGIAHIGFHDWDEHGEWRTIHGQSLHEAGYAKFHPGEPNNASAQYCGGVYKNGLLDDFWCHRRAAFFCEKDPSSLICHEDDYDCRIRNEKRMDDDNEH